MKLKRTNGRSGFTLVEMLVATALIMFIMLILSEAFVAGLNAFRTLKGIGDMESRLKSAVTPIRDDLRQDHFDGRRRLSDPMFWNTGTPREGFVNITQGFSPTTSPTTVPGAPPGQTVNQAITVNPNALSPANPMTNGLTWAIQANTILWITDASGASEEVVVLANPPPTATTFSANFIPGPAGHPGPLRIRVVGQLEGFDADGLPVRRATDHILSLAVKKRGNRPQDFFTAHLPWNSPFFPFVNGAPISYYTPTTFFDQPVDGRYQPQVLPPPPNPGEYKTQWAEVAYFLWPNGTSTPGGTPLFALFRAEYKVALDTRSINGQVFFDLDHVPIHFRFGWYQSPNGDGYNEMCCGINFNPPVPPGFIPFPAYQFYNPSDLAQGTRVFTSPSNPLPNFYNSSLGFYWRGSPFTGQPFDPSFPIPWSATLIATDVVSFDVQILSPQSDVADFTDVPTGVFDTASSTNNYTINAVKITLRVYDLKTRQTRQVTIIQDM